MLIDQFLNQRGYTCHGQQTYRHDAELWQRKVHKGCFINLDRYPAKVSRQASWVARIHVPDIEICDDAFLELFSFTDESLPKQLDAIESILLNFYQQMAKCQVFNGST